MANRDPSKKGIAYSTVVPTPEGSGKWGGLCREALMLGCVGFLVVPSAPWARRLRAPPPPPAVDFGAMLFNVRTWSDAEAAVAFAREIRRVRPAFALGVVVGAGRATALRLLQSNVSWDAVLGAEDFMGGFPPKDRLQPLLAETVGVRIVQLWQNRYGAAPFGQEVLERLAELAASGRGVDGAAAELGMSRATLHRWLKGSGYPAAGVLLRQGRVAAVDIRVRRGVPPDGALRLSGWSSRSAMRKVRGTLGANRLEIDPSSA